MSRCIILKLLHVICRFISPPDNAIILETITRNYHLFDVISWLKTVWFDNDMMSRY